jgi:hypothetical protein
MAIAIGISIVVGLLLGMAGGGLVRSLTIEWRLAANVGAPATWRGKGEGASRHDPAAGKRDLLLLADDPASCRNCSDFERGYAWAERSGVASTGECESYSWSYQRGCIAWLRSGRPNAGGSHP